MGDDEQDQAPGSHDEGSQDGDSVTTRPSEETETGPLPDEGELAEIEEERKRRLADENRPEAAEVDNSDATLPTVDKWNEENPPDAAGTSDPSEKFRENPPDEAEQKEMAEERERRLDPDNRPDGVEVDNTGRTFEDGHFVD